MIDIYDCNGNKLEYSAVLSNLPITESCEHVEELMKADYIVLSWRDSEKYTLPVGAYITYKGVNYALLEPYEPEQKSGDEFEYTPNFQHPKMYLGKVPFRFPTTDTDGNSITLLEWPYSGDIDTLLTFFCRTIESELGLAENTFNYSILGEIDMVVSTTFSSMDILSALSDIANKLKCEWHIDWDYKVLYFGHIELSRDEEEDAVLEVGVNVGTPSVRSSKEGFYNTYEPQGSTRNVSKRAASGEYVQGDVRLALNEEDYPDKVIYTNESGTVIASLPQGVKKYVKPLIFDNIYPKLDLYVYDVRCRERDLLDDNFEKIIDHYDSHGQPVYKRYAVWYMRLAYPTKVNGHVTAWNDYTIDPETDILSGKNIGGAFQPNTYEGAESFPLAGRGNAEDGGYGFELHYHTTGETIPASGDDTGVIIKAGDYEIVFQQQNDYILPTTASQGIIPKGVKVNGQEVTDLNGLINLDDGQKGNIVDLFNIVIGSAYTESAQDELANETLKYIANQFKDNNSYTMKSDVVAFKKQIDQGELLHTDSSLYIGEKVIYKNGDYELETRVMKLVTKLDYAFVQEITVGNEVLKGSTTTLKEQVQTILSGGVGNGSGGGRVDAGVVRKIVQAYTTPRFLSKVNDDTALGEITLKKGVKIGQYRSRFLGSGAAVDPAGNAEFESIYSRSFISTPEFRFNRISVTEGEQWCTNGYGTIESVVEGVDEYGNEINGGIITLHLEENDFASVAAGDICRGIYNDIAGTYNPPAMDNDASYAAGSYKEGSGIGFSAKKGFFTSYFYIDHIITREQGECSFVYKLRSSTTPHPCPFMKFAQYGSFTDATRRASSYATSIGHYYEMVLEGVQTWTIESANIVYRKGYLGDLVIELADGTSRQLQGYGLYAQNNVYFGNAVIQLDPYTLEMLEEDLSTYDVSFGEHVDMIVVDDTGNVIGGIYTETEEGGVTTREYRIHSAITVRKKGALLTEALAGAEAGLGTYKINFTPVGCSAMIENSTMYITGIDHVKDGVAGSGDDTDFDYDAMRAVDSCRVDFTIDCEGKTSIQKSIPIAIKHDSQPFVGADITNEFSAVSWNTKTQQYAGLPIVFDFKMWHNDEVLDIVSANDVSVTLSDGTAIPDTWTYTKTIVENASGNKVAHIVISALPDDLGLVTDLNITCVATYSGVRYERTLVHTINKSTDTNVYSLIPSVDEVVVDKNTGGLSSNSVDISVVCDSSDNKHYAVAYNQFGTHQLCICYKKFYTDGTSDANETEYTGTAVSVNSGVERVSFFLYKKVGTTIDRTVLHDKEDVPIIANGQDGKGIEYIFITKADWDGTDADKPSIEEEDTSSTEFQRDNHCPYTDSEHTAQWTDEPTGVASNAKFEFYAQRKKVNGVWQEFGEVKLWNRYVVDGVTPYVIDLSNEQSMVACNESGTVVGSYETSKLMLFYGQSYAFNDFAITITPTNITCNNSAVAFTLTAEQKAAAQTAGYFTLTPSEIKADSATIAVTATKGNIVLNAVYKVNKAYAGKNGVIYSLITSLDTIRRGNNGSLADSTVDIQVKVTVGASATILSTLADMTAEGLTLKYENATTQSAQTFSVSASIATSTLVGSSGAGTWGKILLVKNNIIVDQERINVVSDGRALTSTNIYYTADTTAPTTPTGAPSLNTSWVDDGNTLIINSNASKHLYESTCTTYSNGTYSWSTPVDDGLIQDMAGAAEEYALADNNSTAPTTGWSSTVTPTKGKWVWSRTVLTFSDSSTTAINTQCVGYCGYNGDVGYGIVLTLTRDNYTEDNWAAYAVVGANENFGYSGGVTVRAGDYFIVEGISTDSGLMHTATFKCTSQTSTKVYGDCISHICDGEKGSYYVKEYAVGDSRTTAPTSGWGSTQPSPSDGQYVWERSRLYNPNTGTYGSYVYVCLTGKSGTNGARGRMYHIMGEYSPSTPYTLTDDLCPVVYYNGSYYYLKKDSPQGGNAPTDNSYWGAASDFEMVFTKALFAAFAQLGGFIVWNNWFISQKGTVGGVADQTVNNNFTGTMTDSGSNFIPYLAFDAATGNLYAKKGVIGGFDINSDFLGNTSGDYYTYLSPDGYLALKNPKTGNHAHANGAIYVQGGALIQGDDTHPLRLLNSNGETEVKGNPLNINTNAALTTNIGNGGSTSILSVNSKTTFQQPVSVNTSMEIAGLFAEGGNIKMSSFTLPESPKIGQKFFCKGVTTDLTVSVKPGTSHVIMASDSRLTVTSLSLQDNSAILVYMKENTWVHFRCD